MFPPPNPRSRFFITPASHPDMFAFTDNLSRAHQPSKLTQTMPFGKTRALTRAPRKSNTPFAFPSSGFARAVPSAAWDSLSAHLTSSTVQVDFVASTRLAVHTGPTASSSSMPPPHAQPTASFRSSLALPHANKWDKYNNFYFSAAGRLPNPSDAPDTGSHSNPSKQSTTASSSTQGANAPGAGRYATRGRAKPPPATAPATSDLVGSTVTPASSANSTSKARTAGSQHSKGKAKEKAPASNNKDDKRSLGTSSSTDARVKPDAHNRPPPSKAAATGSRKRVRVQVPDGDEDYSEGSCTPSGTTPTATSFADGGEAVPTLRASKRRKTNNGSPAEMPPPATIPSRRSSTDPTTSTAGAAKGPAASSAMTKKTSSTGTAKPAASKKAGANKEKDKASPPASASPAPSEDVAMDVDQETVVGRRSTRRRSAKGAAAQSAEQSRDDSSATGAEEPANSTRVTRSHKKIVKAETPAPPTMKRSPSARASPYATRASSPPASKEVTQEKVQEKEKEPLVPVHSYSTRRSTGSIPTSRTTSANGPASVPMSRNVTASSAGSSSSHSAPRSTTSPSQLSFSSSTASDETLLGMAADINKMKDVIVA